MTEKNITQKYQETYQDDEIDLHKLFLSVGNFFARMWMGIIYLIIRIRRETLDYKILFIILIVTGFSIGFVVNKTSIPQYKSSMLLSSSIIKGQLVENVVNKLNLLSQEEDPSQLSSILGISLEDAKSIVGIEAIPYVTEEEIIQAELLKEKLLGFSIEEDEINMVIDRIKVENKSLYEIVAYVYDAKTIVKLEHSILSYFRDNPYLSKRLEIDKKIREQKIAKLRLERLRLDSLKTVIYNNLSSISDGKRGGSNNIILAEDNTNNPLSIIREDIDLYYQELTIERELALDQELEVVDGFTNFRKPDNIKPRQTIVYSILIAIGVGYIFILLKSINSYLTRVEGEY